MPEGVTDQREDEELGDALDGELLVSVARREQPPAYPGNAHPEGAGRRRGQGRNIVGDLPLAEMAIALVAGGDEGLHVSIGREYAGRHPFGLRMIAGVGIVIHAHPLAPPINDRASARPIETLVTVCIEAQGREDRPPCGSVVCPKAETMKWVSTIPAGDGGSSAIRHLHWLVSQPAKTGPAADASLRSRAATRHHAHNESQDARRCRTARARRGWPG